jgi:hypothetical protein
MPYEILRRRDYAAHSRDLPLAVRRKADWAIVQLGVRGRTPSTKGTIGHALPWRRSPVQGSHYYLWWLNAGESGLALNGERAPGGKGAPRREGAIIVHSIRHHDDTDRPIAVGDVAEYEPLELLSLDPRFDDQAEVALNAQEGDVSFVAIEGMPGSGKSVALLYLARDLALAPGTGKVRYITYTEGLKRAAREVRDSLGPEVAERITVQTINDVVKQLTGRNVASDPYSEIGRFTRDVERLPAAQVGLWKNYPLTLYTELRAQVVGRTFPRGYQLPAHREEQLRTSGGTPDVEKYARRRKLDEKAAGLLLQLAERFQDGYFLDQVEARNALARLTSADAPAWVRQSDAFIIDEVQDFTPLQIALIAEMAAARRRARPDQPLSLTIAGDESQIVQPTGFTWGIAKDIIHKRLGVAPFTTRFEAQRRSPQLLTRLTQASWKLYSALPKELRPSAVQIAEPAQPDADPLPDNGLIILAPPPGTSDAPQWRALLAELGARPGRALIDLSEETEPAHPLLAEAAVEGAALADSSKADSSKAEGAQAEGAADVIFKAREIKGLERGTVLVHGLQQTWERLEALTSATGGERIRLLEARRLIDQMRVALSRSTNRLVFLEAPDASVFAQLDFAPADSALLLSLGELTELLQGDQMTDTEIVFALMDEAEELAERDRLEDALRRNRRAAAISQQTSPTDITRTIHLQEADLLVLVALRELDRAQISAALEARRQADALYSELGPDVLFDERAERWELLRSRLDNDTIVEFAHLVENAERALADGRVAEASDGAASALLLVLPASQQDDPAFVLPHTAGDEEAARIARAIDLSLRADLALADQLSRSAGDSEAVAPLLARAARLRALQVQPASARLLEGIGARYSELPQRSGHGVEEVKGLVRRAQKLLDAIREQPADEEARLVRDASILHLSRWLEEAFADLGNHLALYHPWATVAVHLHRAGGYPALDERMWELEQRFDAAGAPSGHFAAFRAAYNGDPASASILWEQLGELDLAIEAAREAGDLERAGALLRSNHRTLPEDLATALRVLRLVGQLQHKHHTLREGERRTLAEELARLHAALTSEDEEP